MKIAFDHQVFTDQRYGGISRYIVELAKALNSSGVDSKIFAGLHRNYYLRDAKDIKYEGAFFSKFGKLRRRFNFHYGRFQTARWKPNVIHETYYSADPRLDTKIPRVVTVYDMIHELFSHEVSPKDKTTMKKRSALARASHIIAISLSTKNDLVRLFDVDPDHITVVHLANYTSINDQLRPYQPERPYLLYVGSRGGYKNFSRFLEAFARSGIEKDFDVIAFGGGVFRANEYAQISALGLNPEQVKHLTGSDDLLSQLYQGAFAFVYPSLYEGFGLPPLEAMANSCPVISSNTSSMPEVIGNAAEYFDPTEIDDLTRAIQRITSDPARRKELQMNGLERIKLFSWQKCAEETKSVYQKIDSSD